MAGRKMKIKLPASPWHYEMAGRKASLDVADMFGDPVFDLVRPYDEEVETTKFIVHAANAIFALAEQELRDPLEMAIDLEMRTRNVTREDVLVILKPRKKKGYFRWQMREKIYEENKCVSN
jgi:hypothetical protein